jgi:hypothetical protein
MNIWTLRIFREATGWRLQVGWFWIALACAVVYAAVRA